MNLNFIKCQVAILAGGMGTRLRERSGDLPKPMVPLLGRPILQHQIELCRKHGFTQIALLVQHRHEKISEYFGDGSTFGVKVSYSIEGKPRGTAGALRDALPLLADRFLVLYGDTFMDVDLRKFWNAHDASGAAGTLFLHPNDHPQDSDLVDVDADGAVRSILTYPHPKDREVRNLVNAALYVLDCTDLEEVTPAEGKADIAKHMFPCMLERGRRLYGYVSAEYIKDMGTPERLDKVERDYVAGLPERLSGRQLRSAVFLDRDGTLIREVNHLKRPDQLQLIPGAGDAIRMLNRAGILAVGVTNQPVLARGDVTWAELDVIHARLDLLLGAKKAYLDALYVCPHHPDQGFEGEVPELKVQCNCRKPETGLIDKAVRELSIDRRKSWMVGDTTSDMLAGKRAGLRTVLVRTGYAGLDGKYDAKPDYVVPDMKAAVDLVLHGHGSIVQQLFDACAEASKARLVLIGGVARSGKSTVAAVLSEMIGESGRHAHVISLDGWLKPVENRTEGQGVTGRYDMGAAKGLLLPLMQTKDRHVISVPQYERKSRSFSSSAVHSIGPNDLLIVEGVTALLDEEILEHAAVKVYVDVAHKVRVARLNEDYAWRDEEWTGLELRLASREMDEVPIIQAGASVATHRVFSE